jgi:hypothetical protein
MKLAHIILLSSAGAWTVLGAGAVAEKSAVSLGPHLSQPASELLDMYPAYLGPDNIHMCHVGHCIPSSCYDFIMSRLVNGTDSVRYVTRECGIKCRQFRTNCTWALGEISNDWEFAHALRLMRDMIGIRQMTMLERWGLVDLHPLDLIGVSVSSLGRYEASWARRGKRTMLALAGAYKTWPRSRAPLWKRLMYPLAGASLFFFLAFSFLYARVDAARRVAEDEEPKGPPPASAATLANLPVRPARADELSGENSTCCVCFEALREGDSVAKLPCGHVYHVACVKNWLIQHCTCPNCRYELPTDDASFERMPHPGTTEMVRSGLLWWGELSCAAIAGGFLAMAAGSLLLNVAGEANSEESATAGL